MARTPRLSKADLADLAARHKAVTARVMAAEDIARQVIREPIDDATRHLVTRVAGESAVGSVKRELFLGARQVSEALTAAAARAVTVARERARALATSQAASDLASFAKQAQAQGMNAVTPALRAITATSELDAAVAHQAGLSLAARWSSQVQGAFVQWKRESGGSDGLVRRLQQAGSRGLDNAVETHAITQSVDAYADQHALTWRQIAEEVAGTAHSKPEAAGDPWGAGMFDCWSAILDRRTCSVCSGLDGKMIPIGDSWGPGGRPPAHVRCRCLSCSVWVPEAAAAKMAQAHADYELLKADIRDYMRGATLDLGEGKRHARAFFAEAMAGHSPTVLQGLTANRRAYFPHIVAARPPRLLF